MEALYHKTSALLEEVHHCFVKLEKSSPSEAHLVENEISAILNETGINCEKLSFMVNKELPHRRMTARTQVEQLKYDCNHYRTALKNAVHRRLAKEEDARAREELLSKTFRTNDAEATSIMIDHSLVQNRSLQNVHRGVDDLLGSGSNVLQNLKEQRGTLKGAQKKILDIANTLGLSNTVMRLIERRTYQDKFILFIGMFVTCVIMFLVYKYLG